MKETGVSILRLPVHSLLTKMFKTPKTFYSKHRKRLIFIPIYMQNIYEVVRYGKNKRLYSPSCRKFVKKET